MLLTVKKLLKIFLYFLIILVISFFPIWSNFFIKWFLNQNFQIPYYEIYQTVFILILTTYMSFLYGSDSKNDKNSNIQIIIVLLSLIFATISLIQQQISITNPNILIFNDFLFFLIVISSMFNFFIFYKDFKLKEDPTTELEKQSFNTIEKDNDSTLSTTDFPILRENIFFEHNHIVPPNTKLHKKTIFPPQNPLNLNDNNIDNGDNKND